MKTEFFDGYPHAAMAERMRSLLATARRIDAAVAFVTSRGTAVLRELLEGSNPPDVRLVVSVRFPTNLTNLRNLALKLPGRVWIHTGYREPHEPEADRGQFHSKLVVADLDGDERIVIVGSHNWTSCALYGDNLEAGVILHCREADDAVQSARRHIEACLAESQRFDPNELRFYETVQRRLHVGPPRLATDGFPGFEWFESLVIHAEDGTSGNAPAPLRLFVPVREPGAATFFRDGRQVQFFLYPPGTLHGHRPPAAMPALFGGRITMINELSDAPVGQRLADCELTDLRRPMLKMLAGNVPAPSGESRQVIIHLDFLSNERLPIYHSDANAPNLKLDVSYQTIDLNELLDAKSLPPNREPGAARDHAERRRPRRVDVPHRLLVTALVCVANRDLFDFDIERLLRYGLHGSEFINHDDSPDVEVKIGKPAKKEVLNELVYNVYYRFTKEALARAEEQMKLF